MSEEDSWRDQVALVSGGAGSIGSAIVDRFLILGARVASSDSRPRKQPEHNDRERSDVVDVTDSRQVDAWVENVSSAWGTPTIAVMCAGMAEQTRLVETGDSDWRRTLSVNLDGAFYMARAVIRSMLRAGGGGRLVFVGSWAAHAPHPHIGSYSVAKAGLRALCSTLALDHAQDGILVNEVAPGIVDAGVSRELFQRDPVLEKRTMMAIPSGKLILPEDVARDVAFLASPGNRHTTGAVLVSDGGISLSSTMNTGRDRAPPPRSKQS